MSEDSTVSLHTIENGEMTPTLKVRRHAITARYSAMLEGLY